MKASATMHFRNEYEIQLNDHLRRQEAARHQHNNGLAAQILKVSQPEPRRAWAKFILMFWARPRHAQQQLRPETPSGATTVILPSAGK